MDKKQPEKCKHKFARGAKEGESCKAKGKHDGYCYKHKKTVVPDEIVEAVSGAKPEAPPKKLKYSSFRWTLNGNTSAAKMSPADVAEFKRLVGFIFAEDKVPDYLLDRTSPDDPRVNMIELKSTWFFEVAPTTKALHAHGILKASHHGNYSLQIDIIREILTGCLGKKCHFNVTASGDPDAAWEQYMQKNQAAEKV